MALASTPVPPFAPSVAGGLNTAPERSFARIATLAADLFQAASASVVLLDEVRQGFHCQMGSERVFTPFEDAFCTHAIKLGPQAVMVVEDAHLDPRFADNPFVVGPPWIRFYAGACLTDPQGRNLGTLCVTDSTPRPTPGPCDMAQLKAFARVVADDLSQPSKDLIVSKQRNLLTMAEHMSGVGAWRYDVHTQRSSWSPSIHAIYGVDPATFDNCLAADLECLVEEDRPLAAMTISEAIAGQGDFDYQVRIRRPDGELRVVRTRGACELDDFGEVAALFGVSQDVTDQQRALEDLRASRDAAESAAKAKEDFLANMSHELRTPLNSIVGFSGLIAAAPELSIETRRRAELVSGASRALVMIVNDILDFSKIQAEGVSLQLEPVRVEDVLISAVALVREEAGRKGVGLTLETGGLATAFMLDPSRMRQVVLNLLSNAIKFTGAGGRVALKLAETRPGRLEITVADTGVGIPAALLDSIFDRFSQGDGTTARRFGGTGLGLTICRSLVEAMGGVIDAESVVGRGSTFRFCIEAAPAPAANRPTPATVERARAAPGQRVLIADDNEINRDLFRALMDGEGLEIHEACDGREAVEAVRTTAFDMVLMDLQMPLMDGLEATRAIRALGFADLPIVALTANVMQAQIDLCLEAGMDGHLGKPFAASEVLAALTRWTRRSACAPAPGAAVLAAEVLDGLRATLGPAALDTFLERLAGQMHAVAPRLVPPVLDAPELGRMAHKVRGLAAGFGFVALAKSYEELEQVCTSGGDLEGSLARAERATRDSLATIEQILHPQRARSGELTRSA